MSKFIRSEYENLVQYTPGEQIRGIDVVKLNTNELPYPPSPRIKALFTDEMLNELRLYPDPSLSRLKEDIARRYRLDIRNVFVSNGSDEAINFSFMAFGSGGVCFPDITYGFYKVFAELNCIPFREISLDKDFKIDIENYKNLNKMIILANPNAPTGYYLTLEKIEEILRANLGNIVVIDEAYIDFCSGYDEASAVNLLDKYENLLVIRTFSKSYALAGARVGYALGNFDIISDLEKIRYSINPYNINSISAEIARISIEDEEYHKENIEKVKTTREFLTTELKKRGFLVLDSETNFVFTKPYSLAASDLYERLKEKNILIRYFNSERIDKFVRISIGTEKEIKRLLEAIDGCEN